MIKAAIHNPSQCDDNDWSACLASLLDNGLSVHFFRFSCYNGIIEKMNSTARDWVSLSTEKKSKTPGNGCDKGNV
ncbi:hypothetical protein DPV78_005747 [Talaromyces pinophilus]|nr:hypothetical protein DPV78_005747 [Talaromyces pinophilus]